MISSRRLEPPRSKTVLMQNALGIVCLNLILRSLDALAYFLVPTRYKSCGTVEAVASYSLRIRLSGVYETEARQ